MFSETFNKGRGGGPDGRLEFGKVHSAEGKRKQS